MAEATVEDIAAMRADGSLREYFQHLTGRPVVAKPEPGEDKQRKPGYHIPSPGAWPCGTAPSGPTPPPCTHTGDQP